MPETSPPRARRSRPYDRTSGFRSDRTDTSQADDSLAAVPWHGENATTDG
jgi:hypothetical protein